MKNYAILFSTILLSVTFMNCEEANEILNTEELVEITNQTVEGIEVAVAAPQALFVGYNTVSVELKNEATGKAINDATISIKPMMHMMTMSHSCPIENAKTTIGENGKYEFNVVFVMPSGDMGNWDLTLTIDQNNTITEVVLPITVVQPEESKLVSFVSEIDGTTKYFVALIDPSKPQIGSNELEIAVFKKQTMMEWPSVDGLTFELEPWMTSMDHSSPNNEAPINVGNGHYKGKVNFTMTGDWEMRLKMMEDEKMVGTPTFFTVF